ncbi:amino acid permease [Candidatus Babeliales bacterium]|nr:amino acid permease [Candidatus Babeliales bacterium]
MSKSSSASNGKISWLAAAIIGMNAMIGVGIVTIPTMLSQKVGPAGILSYVISIALVVSLGVSLARVAHRYPGEGWTYLYPSQWAGHKVGMISAASYVVGVLVAMGFLIQQAGIWAQHFIPFVSAQTLGLSIIFILMFLVLAGTEASSIVQYIIGALVVIPLMATAIVCWMNFNPALLKPFMPYGPVSVFAAAPKALFAFFGFECVISLYSVVREPKKNVPKAFLFAILFVGGLYVFFAGGLLAAVPVALFGSGIDTTLAQVLQKAFPQYGLLSGAVLVGAMFGIIGTLHSMLWATSSLLTAVLKRSRSGVVQIMLARKMWNNTISVLLCTAIMVISSIVFHAEALVDLTDLLLIMPSMLSIISLFFISKEWERGRNVVVIIALFGSLTMLYFAGSSLVQALIG